MTPVEQLLSDLIILLKLVASRYRDLGDVQDILFMQDQLDESYMRKWAAELDVSRALEQALQEALGR